MEARGLATGVPKMVVSGESQKIYTGIVADLKKCFAEWGMAPAAAV
jgi:hypothetical protein